jgi:hypothetical protein
MGRWEHRYLGWDRFPDPSTPIEIEQLFTLESDELACAKARRTPLHRLAVALHIVFLKTTRGDEIARLRTRTRARTGLHNRRTTYGKNRAARCGAENWRRVSETAANFLSFQTRGAAMRPAIST